MLIAVFRPRESAFSFVENEPSRPGASQDKAFSIIFNRSLKRSPWTSFQAGLLCARNPATESFELMDRFRSPSNHGEQTCFLSVRSYNLPRLGVRGPLCGPPPPPSPDYGHLTLARAQRLNYERDDSAHQLFRRPPAMVRPAARHRKESRSTQKPAYCVRKPVLRTFQPDHRAHSSARNPFSRN